jgi:hypothetical protein
VSGELLSDSSGGGVVSRDDMEGVDVVVGLVDSGRGGSCRGTDISG